MRRREDGCLIRVDLVDEPDFLGAGGIEVASGVGEFGDVPLRDDARQSLQRADIGRDPDLRFAYSEGCIS